MSTTAVKITCNTRKTWVTEINCNFADAVAYFSGKTFTDENHETGEETRHTFTKVEEVKP